MVFNFVDGEIWIVGNRRRNEETQWSIWKNSKGFGVEMRKLSKICYFGRLFGDF
jgi:hypothetical protein